MKNRFEFARIFYDAKQNRRPTIRTVVRVDQGLRDDCFAPYDGKVSTSNFYELDNVVGDSYYVMLGCR